MAQHTSRSQLNTQNSEHPLTGFPLHIFHRRQKNNSLICVIGKLDNGETFAWTDDRVQPRFYVRVSDRHTVETQLETYNVSLSASAWTTMDGEPVLCLSGQLSSMRRLGDLLQEKNIRTYEADLNITMQYYIYQALRGSVRIDGPWRKGDGVDRVYYNPVLTPADWEPKLAVLSIDIETNVDATEVFAAALVGAGPENRHRTEEIHMVGPVRSDDPPNVICYPTERLFLDGLVHRIRAIDPDVLTGWNVIDFDLPVLAKRCEVHEVIFNPGRTREEAWHRESRIWGGSSMVVYGRQVLDALHMIRSTLLKFDDYRLGTVAQALLGRGKTLAATDDEGMAELIRRAYLEDRQAFCEYCLEDARLVQDIIEQEGLIRLTVRRTMLTGLPLERVWGSIAPFETMYISELHQRGLVAPTVGVDRTNQGGSPGGMIITPQAGLHEHVWVFDFRSLYPSIMRTFNIDPLAYIQARRKHKDKEPLDPITAPNGAVFDREPGILPDMLARFFEQRAQAKVVGDDLASFMYKILMNAFYGVLATGACRFSDNELVGAITGFAHHFLTWVRDLLEQEGYHVLYGDTDSVFVASGLPGDVDVDTALQNATALCEQVNAQLEHYITEEYRVTSYLELEFEKYYRRFFLPTTRGSDDRGRAKGYAGLRADTAGEHLEIVGMEAVRRDWTDMAHDLQRELLELVFHDANRDVIEERIFQWVSQVHSGRLDKDLVYRKSLRKPVKDYTRTQPPHVQAARLMENPSGVIHYVITTEGPQPASRATAPLDYDHYVLKQIEPLVRTVAEFYDIDVDASVNGRPDLFR
jgi:DNA polymerase-2